MFLGLQCKSGHEWYMNKPVCRNPHNIDRNKTGQFGVLSATEVEIFGSEYEKSLVSYATFPHKSSAGQSCTVASSLTADQTELQLGLTTRCRSCLTIDQSVYEFALTQIFQACDIIQHWPDVCFWLRWYIWKGEKCDRRASKELVLLKSLVSPSLTALHLLIGGKLNI